MENDKCKICETQEKLIQVGLTVSESEPIFYMCFDCLKKLTDKAQQKFILSELNKNFNK